MPSCSLRYGHVVAVVGWNSNKKYLVMPEERATLLRKMLEGSTEDVSNVRVEGEAL
jgi:phosphopantetheine adenylyltransferase